MCNVGRTRYPPAAYVVREYVIVFHQIAAFCAKCSVPCRTIKDTIMPLSTPLRGLDGKMMHEIVVPKDSEVMIGILASNKNKALWGEDAHEWKPERWLQPLPDAVLEAKIPGVYANLYVICCGVFQSRSLTGVSDAG